MTDPSKYLEASWRKRSEEALEKVSKAINELQAAGEPINFHTVHLKSGVSKNYLYTNETVRDAGSLSRGCGAKHRTKEIWCAKGMVLTQFYTLLPSGREAYEVPESILAFFEELQKAALLLGIDLRREKENQ